MTGLAREPLLGHGSTGRHSRIPAVGTGAARAIVMAFLSAAEGSRITLVEGRRHRTLGRRGPDPYGRPHLTATITVTDPRFHAALVTAGSAGLGEAYRLGWFAADDLTAACRIMARAMRRLEPARLGLHRLVRPVSEPLRRLRRGDPARDRANIEAHYDLGDEFFELFLDPSLTYSSGWFEHPGVSLEKAQEAKLERLCRHLRLEPGMRVAEIGTGWGSFAIHAASRHGVEVLTTTLSARQRETAARRVREAGLEHLVEVRGDHYRNLLGSFDAVVAIEMIEAVDWRELDDFVAHCSRITSPQGAVGLQAIVAAPRRHTLARDSNDFIKTHIFPGGTVPSVPSILEAAARRTDLMPVALEDFGLHYAETLRRWRQALADRSKEARSLCGDEQFLRLWELYLAYCEAGFEERQISVAQMVLERPGRSRSI